MLISQSHGSNSVHLSDFEHGMVVGARRAGLSISKTADLLEFWRSTISRVYREWSKNEKISSERQLCERKCLVDVRGQRRMGRLVGDDRNATVTKITTRYNQGMHNTISESTTRRTLKQKTTPGAAPSAKNMKRRLQFTQAQQNWTIEDWKNVAWSDESRFLLQHSDGRVRIWRKNHESMDPWYLSRSEKYIAGLRGNWQHQQTRQSRLLLVWKTPGISAFKFGHFCKKFKQQIPFCGSLMTNHSIASVKAARKRSFRFQIYLKDRMNIRTYFISTAEHKIFQ